MEVEKLLDNAEKILTPVGVVFSRPASYRLDAGCDGGHFGACCQGVDRR